MMPIRYVQFNDLNPFVLALARDSTDRIRLELDVDDDNLRNREIPPLPHIVKPEKSSILRLPAKHVVTCELIGVPG